MILTDNSLEFWLVICLAKWAFLMWFSSAKVAVERKIANCNSNTQMQAMLGYPSYDGYHQNNCCEGCHTDYITKNITKTIGIKLLSLRLIKRGNNCPVMTAGILALALHGVYRGNAEQKHFVNFTRCLTCKWACTSSHMV